MSCYFKKSICSSLLFVGLSAAVCSGADSYSLYSKGEKAFAAKNYTKAAELYKKSLSYSPADLRIRFRYGQALFLEKKYKESSLQFQSILQNSPGNISARLYYSESLINLGAPQDAEPHLEWILKVQPSNERARIILDQITGRDLGFAGEVPPPPFAGEKKADKSERLENRSLSKEKPKKTVEKNVALKAESHSQQKGRSEEKSTKKSDFPQLKLKSESKGEREFTIKADDIATNPTDSASREKKTEFSGTPDIPEKVSFKEWAKQLEQEQKEKAKAEKKQKTVLTQKAEVIPEKTEAVSEKTGPVVEKKMDKPDLSNTPDIPEKVSFKEWEKQLEEQKSSDVSSSKVSNVSEKAKDNRSVAVNTKPFKQNTPSGFIHIAPRPAVVRPVDYQYSSEEDKFMNYPAEAGDVVISRKTEGKPKFVPDEHKAKTVKIRYENSKQEALSAVTPDVRARVEAVAAAKAHSIETAEKVNSAVYSTANHFAEEFSGSYVVNLERARYFMEKGDLRKALNSLADAEQIAYDLRNTKTLLEARIFQGLLYIYNMDYKAFGRHLMALQSSMPKDKYQNFLDIYNQGLSCKTDSEKAKMSAGVAIGAGHFVIASNLLKTAFEEKPEDQVIGRLLSDSQIQSRDYKGAEKTLLTLAEKFPESSEANYNLARFYITADYQPDKARAYGNKAVDLAPEDARGGIVLGLLDFTEGNIEAGLARIKNLMATVEDSALKGICERIIAEGENNPHADFAAMLALPGTPRASSMALRILGEQCLQRGLYFSALECYEEMGDKAELGRTLLGIAAAMKNADESAYADKVYSYGMTLLSEALENDPRDPRANLYIALYYYEQGDIAQAENAVLRGLDGNPDIQTRNRLFSVKQAVDSSKDR